MPVGRAIRSSRARAQQPAELQRELRAWRFDWLQGQMVAWRDAVIGVVEPVRISTWGERISAIHRPSKEQGGRARIRFLFDPAIFQHEVQDPKAVIYCG